MDEKEIERSLEAIRIAGAEVTSSPEASLRFLQELGLLDGEGHLKEQFKDYVPPVHNTAQSGSGISRM